MREFYVFLNSYYRFYQTCKTYLNFLWKHYVAVERDEFVAKGLFEVALAIDVIAVPTAFVQYRQAAVD